MIILEEEKESISLLRYLVNVPPAQLINVLLLLAAFLWAWIVRFLLRHSIDIGAVVQLSHPWDQFAANNARLKTQSTRFTTYLARVILPLTLLTNILHSYIEENKDANALVVLMYTLLPLGQAAFLIFSILKTCGVVRYCVKRCLVIESSPRALRNVYILFSDTVTSFNKPIIDFALYLTYLLGIQITHFDLFLAVIPPVIRLCQCLKEYKTTKEFTLLANALKYSCHLPVVLCLWYSRVYGDDSLTIRDYNILKVMMFIQSTYSYIWDVRKDWTITSISSIRYQKSRVLFPKFYYHIAIVMDGIMRYWWLWIIILAPYDVSGKPTALFFEKEAQFIELIRRAGWVVFKLESEYSSRDSDAINYQKESR